jgi:hypothetical protein
MKRQSFQLIAGRCLLVASLAAVAGCTGTDFIDSGTAQVSFETTVVNPSSTDYECVLLRINGMTLRPIDPEAAALLGNSSLGAVTSSTLVNFSDQACSQFPNPLPNVTLTVGTYQIATLLLGGTGTQIPAMLFDQESNTRLRCFSGPVDVTASFPQPIVIEEGRHIRLVIDEQALEQHLQGSIDNPNFSCQELFDNIADVLEIQ